MAKFHLVDAEEAEEYFKIPVIGVIPYLDNEPFIKLRQKKNTKAKRGPTWLNQQAIKNIIRTEEVQSENIGNGVYKAIFVPLRHGDYQIWATAWKNDINMGEASFEINATPVNNEFLYTKQDYMFLNKLSAKTGG